MADYSHEVRASAVMYRDEIRDRGSDVPDWIKTCYAQFGNYITLIDKAVKFDLGTHENFINLIANSKGTPFIHLPAPVCTFCFSWEGDDNDGQPRNCFTVAREEERGVLYSALLCTSNPLEHGGYTWFPLRWMLLVTPEGRAFILDDENDGKVVKEIDASFEDAQLQRDENGERLYKEIPYLMAINRSVEVFSCSNIVQVVHKAPKMINKKRKKKGKPLFFEYRTIEIVVGDDKTTTQTDRQGEGGKRRLHFCRGHIRRYKSGKRTWVTGHHRGTAGIGQIQHDYKVKR